MKSEMMHIVKKDKKKLVILGALALVAIALMLIGDNLGGKTANTATNNDETTVTGSAGDYFTETQTALATALSEIAGVGKVEVLIRWDGDVSQNYAYNEETSSKTGDDGTTEQSTKKEMVLLDGDSAPVVAEKIYPQITGVLVVAEGADQDKIRYELQTAVASYLGIGANRIEITAMEVE